MYYIISNHLISLTQLSNLSQILIREKVIFFIINCDATLSYVEFQYYML